MGFTTGLFKPFTGSGPCKGTRRAEIPRHPVISSIDTLRQENNGVRRSRLIACAKAKKGKGGKQKKGPGSLMDIPQTKEEEPEVSEVEPYQETPVIMDNLLLVESYFRVMDKPLLEGDVELTDIAQHLWEAPFALLVHDLPEDNSNEEPLFSYANKAALDLFETEWSELVGKPSSISTDSDAQAERSEALGSALQGGKLENFSGWRRSLKGKRFQILGATLFNISSPTDEVIQQGAVIRQWADEDGNVSGPDAPPDTTIPTEDDIKAQEAAVQQQGEAVRSLKEGQGLDNNADPVKEAVADLLKQKAKLESMKERFSLSLPV